MNIHEFDFEIQNTSFEILYLANKNKSIHSWMLASTGTYINKHVRLSI